MNLVLEVRRLSFAHDGSEPLLREVSFTVNRGERLGIVGANGAGKSTLLWCILGLHRASGEVLLFGRPRSRHMLGRVGVVFQNPEDHLFMPALLDDLMLPLRNAGMDRESAEAAALQALRRAGLEEQARAPATRLSLGQRKRAAIAAAMVTAPELLLLDEPTAELDAPSVRRLAAHLAELPAACVIASHHLEFLRGLADRMLVLKSGVVAACGPATEILENGHLLEAAGVA